MAQKSAKIDALQNIDDYDERELVGVLESSRPLGYISTFYNDVFFNLLAAENIAKEEIAGPMRKSLVDAAIGLVEREFTYIHSLQNALKILDESKEIRRAPPRVVLRVVLLNSGHSPDLIAPSATLEVGSRMLKLSLISDEQLRDSSKAQGSEHTAIPAGSAETLFFEIDRKLNTVSANEFVDEVFANSSAVDYEVSLQGSLDLLRKTGTFEPEEVSFEMRF